MRTLQSSQKIPLVVKIGTESLFQGENGTFGGDKIENICADMSHIIQDNINNFILVSSGAVGFGEQIMKETLPFNGLVAKQYLASIGQKALMQAYEEHFSRFGIFTGQVLLTHADIEDDSTRRESLLGVLKSHLMMGTLPIINENDTISTEEMQVLDQGTDNDQNAFLIAKLVGAKTLYIVTNTNGVYRDKNNPDSRIPEIVGSRLSDTFIKSITGGKSKKGTGGMYSKLQMVREAARFGIETHIIDGTRSRLKHHHDGKDYGGTIIRAA